MDMEIKDRKENPLLGREEMMITITHTGEKVPKRNSVITKIAEEMDAKKELVVVDYIKSSFGIAESKVYAKIYKNMDVLKRIEPNFIQKRHGLLKKEEKK